MHAKLFICVMAHCLSLTSGTDNAIQVVLGGSWFSISSVGTSGSYMLSEWKDKIFNPLVTRVAQKVMENVVRLNKLHWMLLALVLWNSLLTVIIFYKTLRNSSAGGKICKTWSALYI